MRATQKIVLTFILSSACILVYQYQLSKTPFLTQDTDRSRTETFNDLVLKISNNNQYIRTISSINISEISSTSVPFKINKEKLNITKDMFKGHISFTKNITNNTLVAESGKINCICNNIDQLADLQDKKVSLFGSTYMQHLSDGLAIK